MNGDYPTHDNPDGDLGKEVQTLNKFINTFVASQKGLSNITDYPNKIITGILNKDPWGDPKLFHIGAVGPQSSQDRIIGKPYRYKLTNGQTGGRKSRMRRKRRNTRRRLRAA